MTPTVAAAALIMAAIILWRIRRAWRREAQRQADIIEQFNRDYPPGD